MQVFIQDREGGVVTTDSLDDVSPGDGRVYWINSFQPSEEEIADLHRLFRSDLAELGEHRLEQPLIHIYPEELLIRWNFIAKPGGETWLERLPVDIFLSADHILTLHHYAPGKASRVFGEIAGYLQDPVTPQQTPGEILYRVLMGSLDRYWIACDILSEYIDSDQKDVFEGDSDEDATSRLRAHKGHNMEFRRLVTAHRHVVLRLIRRDIAFLPSTEARSYLDVYDQLNAVEIELQNNNDIITSSFDVELNMMSNRLNEVMKTLTIVATIFLPLTFLTGLYGMNFRYMPELGWKHGYLFAWGLLVLIAVGMYFLARWITRDKPPGKNRGKHVHHEESGR